MEATPEQHGQSNHEECMCTEVGSDGEVAIEEGASGLALEVGQVGRLPPNQWEQPLAQIVSPFR